MIFPMLFSARRKRLTTTVPGAWQSEGCVWHHAFTGAATRSSWTKAGMMLTETEFREAIDLSNDLSMRMKGKSIAVVVEALCSLLGMAYAFGTEAERTIVVERVAKLRMELTQPATDWSRVEEIVLG
jgi:hypothetical protein